MSRGRAVYFRVRDLLELRAEGSKLADVVLPELVLLHSVNLSGSLRDIASALPSSLPERLMFRFPHIDQLGACLK